MDGTLLASKRFAASDKMFLKIIMYMPPYFLGLLLCPPSRYLIFLLFFRPNDDYTVVAIEDSTKGKDLLPLLNKKHRLQLFQDEYVLKVSDADKERLDLASDEIDLNTLLKPLGLYEVTLATSAYFFTLL